MTPTPENWVGKNVVVRWLEPAKTELPLLVKITDYEIAPDPNIVLRLWYWALYLDSGRQAQPEG